MRNFQNGPVSKNGELTTIFGLRGCIQEGTWLISWHDALVQQDPEPAYPDIQDCILCDFEKGRGEQIHHVIVSRHVAMRLHLEGKLSDVMLEKANTDNPDVLIVHGLEFSTPEGVKKFDVHIVEQAPWHFATVDADGKVV